MGNLVPGRPILNTAMNIYDINIAINVLASILTLVLIWFMRRNGTLKVNLYLKCVLLMTFHQMIFDIALLLGLPCSPSSLHHTCTSVYVGGFVFGGIGASVFALMILVTTAFVIEYNKQPTPKQVYWSCSLLYVFIIGWTIPYAIYAYRVHDNLKFWGKLLDYYNDCRFVIVGLTVTVLLWLQFRMRQITHGQDRSRNPIYHLIRRLIFYPIIQVVCRLGPAPYNYIYKSNFVTYPEDAGATQTFLLFVFVIFTPLAGMGAFLLFLYMQNGAKQELCRLLRCDCQVHLVEASKDSRISSRNIRDDIPQLHANALNNANDFDDCESADQFGADPSKDRRLHSKSGQSHSALEYAYDGSRTSTVQEDWSRLSEMDEGELMREHIRSAESSIVKIDLLRGEVAMKASLSRPSQNPIHSP